jgi:hypothetical protein
VNVRPFLVALFLPLAFTAATLALVGWNRSAGRGPIVLTEQEIYVGYRSDDNTTARIGLAWQQPSRRPPIAAGGPAEERIEPELREGFAALELRETAPGNDLLPGIGGGGPGFGGAAGPGFGGAVSGPRSRLVVVDVDADAATLERRYPDGRTHIIAAARVNVPPGGSFADGFVVSLEPQQIHVPREWAAQLPAFDPTQGRAAGDYEVELWYGVRYEPWISANRRR